MRAAVAELWDAWRDAEQALWRASRRRRGAPRARPTGCAMRSTSSTSSRPQAGEETELADRRAAHDAGREGRGRPARRPGRRRGSASPVPALAAAVRRLERRGAQAPTLVEPAVKALDAALDALDEARGASRSGAARRRFRSAASWSGPRSGCSRCAPPAANTTSPVDELARSRDAIVADLADSMPARSGSPALEKAAAAARRALRDGGRALSAGAPQARRRRSTRR